MPVKPRINRLHHLRGDSGFTLFEVMIALAVFTVCVFAMNRQVAQGISQLDYLEQKSVALWIAQDKLTMLRVKGEWPALGQSFDSLRQINRDWWIETMVTDTSEPLLRRVDVHVGQAGIEEKLVTLHGFMGKH